MAVDINGDGLIALGGTSTTQGRLRLAEDTDNGTNYIELTAPASVGSDRVITFPDATTTVVGTDTTQTLTNKTLGSGLVAGASLITTGTSQASTSGTSIDFTGIPSWVKRITVMFDQVSTNGSTNMQIQLGTSSGVQTTGYVGTWTYTGPGTNGAAVTTGFQIFHNVPGDIKTGLTTLVLFGSNTWVVAGVIANTGAQPGYTMFTGGSKSLGATLDRIRVTTTNGTDTFDAGSINILYE